MAWAFVIYVAYALHQELAWGDLTPCVKVDDCSCKLKSSDQQIDIWSLGYSDKSKAPRFGFKQYNTGYPWEYAYNPCYPWSDGTTSCQNIITCQRDHTHHNNTFVIGDVSATWMNTDVSYYIKYSHGKRTTVVMLNCDETAQTPSLTMNSQLSDTYSFTLTSECCCPGKCQPTPTPSGGGASTISAGSVICIVASVLILVYLLGGILFMKYARQAEGMELIPNVDMWAGLFGYIKDGFIFVFTRGRRPGYSDNS